MVNKGVKMSLFSNLQCNKLMNNRFEFEIRQSILISNQSLLRNLPGRVKPNEDSVESDHAVGIFILSVLFAVKLNRYVKKVEKKMFSLLCKQESHHKTISCNVRQVILWKIMKCHSFIRIRAPLSLGL